MANQLGEPPVKTEEETTDQSMDIFINPSDYSCQILLEKTTLEIANDKTFPNDARLIWYVVDGVEHIDLTRCSKTSKLFDMYYDKYGKGAVQKIEFGYGTVSPKLWGQKPKKEKKRK